jgi:hypothetical protein
MAVAAKKAEAIRTDNERVREKYIPLSRVSESMR